MVMCSLIAPTVAEKVTTVGSNDGVESLDVAVPVTIATFLAAAICCLTEGIA